MKVLLADDDEDYCELLTLQLEGRGFEVAVVHSGQDATDRLMSEHFPIALIDWMMPVLDGIEVCRALRRDSSRPYTYLILATAKSGKRNYLDAIHAGADDFLEKPIDFDLLDARLLVAQRVQRVHVDIQLLGEIVPICMSCHSIQGDAGDWQRLDLYVAKQTGAKFSHGVCPSCFARYEREMSG